MRKLVPVVALAWWGVVAADLAHVHAYNLFGPFPSANGDYYLKWGEKTAGTNGGTVTWSLMTDGTTIAPTFYDPFHQLSGTSSVTTVLNQLGGNEALAAIQRSFDRWSAAANIYFVQVPDYGAPFAGAGALPPTSGHIRIGAYAHTAPIGALGYAPPPNSGSLAGDILLNTNSVFHLVPGGEGDPIDSLYDFEGLMLHEIGHAIGLQHSDVCSVMSVDPECIQSINRELDPDDIAGAQFLYGPPLAADFNRDNVADDDDLAIWQAGFDVVEGATYHTGDADRDGDVDGDDFLVWQREARATSAGVRLTAATAPEPSAYVLMSLVAAALAAARSRRSRRDRGPHHASQPPRRSRRHAADWR